VSKTVEAMCEDLGSKWLTTAVKLKGVAEGVETKKSERARQLEESIRDRAKLMIHRRDGTMLNGIKPDSVRCLQQLGVREAARIRRELIFEGRNRSLPPSVNVTDISMCALSEGFPQQSKKGSKRPVLHLLKSAELNYFDVGHQLATMLTKQSRDVEHLGTSLAQVLRHNHKQLAARGWPVERYMKRREDKKDQNLILNEDHKFLHDDGVDFEHVKAIVDFSRINPSRPVKGAVRGCRCTRSYLDADGGKSYMEEVKEDPVLSSGLKKIDLKFGKVCCYVADDTKADERERRMNGTWLDALGQFAHLLAELAKVCGVKGASIGIFVDEYTNAVAFNNGGGLYFNLGYYRQKHYGKQTAQSQPLGAWMYWYVTMCHEIAHNRHPNHNKDHEHLMESLIVELMPNFLSVIKPVANVISGAEAQTQGASRKRDNFEEQKAPVILRTRIRKRKLNEGPEAPVGPSVRRRRQPRRKSKRTSKSEPSASSSEANNSEAGFVIDLTQD